MLWRAEGAAGSLPALEPLLSEEVLVGSGQLCRAELRPLAFSMLAELVHHARGHLSADQLNHTVHLFCRCAAMQMAAHMRWEAMVLYEHKTKKKLCVHGRRDVWGRHVL